MLNETKKEYAVLLKLSCVVVISLTAFYMLNEKISALTDLLSDYSQLPQLISVMMRGVTVSIVSSVCSDICADSGSASVSRAILLTGRVLIFILSYPLIEAIIEMAVSFAGG